MTDRTSVDLLLRPYRKRIVLLSILAVLSAVGQVLFALVSRDVVDCAFQGGADLQNWGILLLVLILALVLLHILQNWLAGSTSDECIASMRLELLRNAVYSSEERLQGFHSGALLSRGMEDVYTVSDGTVLMLPGVVGQLARLVASFAAVLLVYPPLALLVLLAGLLLIGVMAFLRPILKNRQSSVRQADEQVMSGMQEPLQQLELIQGLDAQEQVISRFNSRLKDSLAAKRSRRFWVVGYGGFLSAASQLSAGIVLLWGAGLISGQMLTFGALTAMLQLLNLIRGPVVGLSGLLTRISSLDVARQRLSELLQEAHASSPVHPGRIHAIVFENVSFRYPGDEAPVLEDFSLRIPLDGWCCLSGISGRGKSTMFKLILGLYEPQKGRVYLEADAGQFICGPATRHLFAYVPQDYALFSGTVLDNLLLVTPDATCEQRRCALQCADAEFVWELSAGEMTPVRENNAGLSKGQLQRLAIARAILMDRPVFLLDECTSALDPQSESKVLENLHALKRQAVLVTHRSDALQPFHDVCKLTLDSESF